MNLRSLLSTAVLALAAAPGLAQEQAPEPVRAELQSLLQEWNGAVEAFREELAQVPRARQRAYHAKHQPKASDRTPLFLKIAEDHPKTPSALEALVWIARYDGNDNAVVVLQSLAQHHADAPELLEVLERIPLTAATEPHYEALRTTSKHPDVRGKACWRLADYTKALYELALFFDGPVDEAGIARQRTRYGAAVCEQVRERGWEPYAARALELYRVLGDQHPELQDRRGKVKDVVAAARFELEHLVPGKVAPEIEGVDLDGVPFQLSDYRGKVVVLDFWGDW